MNVVFVSGSLREGSTNTAAIRTMATLAPDDVATSVYDGLGRLPHFNPDDDRGDDLQAEVAALRQAVHWSDAVLFCTPEYAGALPGSFKNLLEWLVGDAGERSIHAKPVAWVNVASPAAPTGAADAHKSLRKVMGYVGAVIVEHACVRVPLTRDVIGADGLVVDGAARAGLAAAMSALAGYRSVDS